MTRCEPVIFAEFDIPLRLKIAECNAACNNGATSLILSALQVPGQSPQAAALPSHCGRQEPLSCLVVLTAHSTLRYLHDFASIVVVRSGIWCGT